MDNERNFFSRRAVKVFIGIICVCAVMLGVFTVFLYTGDTMARGVSINGRDVSKRSVDYVRAMLDSENKNEDYPITVYTKEGMQTVFSASDIALVFDTEKTAESAYNIGRDKNPVQNFITRTLLLFKPCNITQAIACDEEKLDEILFDLGVRQNGELKNYILDFGDGYVNVKRGEPGQSRDVTNVRNAVISALENGEDNILAELEMSNPPEPDLETLCDEIYIEPIDAQYEIADKKVHITPEIYGRKLDEIEAGTQIEKLKNGETVTLKLVTLTPSVTIQSINEQLFNHILGKYTTGYATSTKNRSANVELAARKINGIILAPDEEFSYNAAVGPRTSANGFREAPMFENGETVQGTGGGVCQVSSTLYSAVLYADLKVLERQNHSMTVAYVPKGQDATVSYGSIDFRFKNDTAYPIKIEAYAAGGRMTVAILGTKPDGDKVVTVTNNVLETKQPTVSETQDSNMLVGNKKVISSGRTGYTVDTVRTVSVNGKEVKREKMGRSVYKMIPTKVAIGAKVPQPLPTLAPTPTPVPEANPQEDTLQTVE